MPEGWRFDRTQEYRARRRGEDVGPFQYATCEILEFSPLPCWKHLTPEQRQQRAAALAAEVNAEAAALGERTGVKPLGPEAILAQSPHSQPTKIKKSPAPAAHAATKAVRRDLRNANFIFVAAYRDASAKLRARKRDTPFPMGCFPPALSWRPIKGDVCPPVAFDGRIQAIPPLDPFRDGLATLEMR